MSLAAPIFAEGGGIESLIYLVFVLFWLAANVLQARSKKNKRPSPPTRPARDRHSADDEEEDEGEGLNPFEQFARQLEEAREALHEPEPERPVLHERPSPEIRWDPEPQLPVEVAVESAFTPTVRSLAEQEKDIYRIDTRIEDIREVREMRLEADVEAARSLKQQVQLVDLSSTMVSLLKLPLESGVLFTGTPVKVKNLRKKRNLRAAVLDQIILGAPKAMTEGREDLPGMRP